MKRLHVHVGVEDLETSIRFYSTLFAAEPTVSKPDYAKWMLDDPRVNFAISSGHGAAGVRHLGIQAEDAAELAEIAERLERADTPVLEEDAAVCCYAKSKKAWISALAAAGLKEIEVGSFVPAKVIPAMADTGEIVAHAKTIAGLKVVALAPNFKGFQRALESGAHKITFPVSASHQHSVSNVRMTPDEMVAQVRQACELRLTLPAGQRPEIEGAVATAFGCFFIICKCIKISLVRFFVPQSWLPSKSTRHMSDGFSEPLLTSVGVQMAMSSPTRMAMLPPLPST